MLTFWIPEEELAVQKSWINLFPAHGHHNCRTNDKVKACKLFIWPKLNANVCMSLCAHAQMYDCACETKYLVNHHWHQNDLVQPSLFGLGMNWHPYGYGGVLTLHSATQYISNIRLIFLYWWYWQWGYV